MLARMSLLRGGRRAAAVRRAVRAYGGRDGGDVRAGLTPVADDSLRTSLFPFYQKTLASSPGSSGGGGSGGGGGGAGAACDVGEKTVKDSAMTVTLPFSTTPALVDQYASGVGNGLRVGRLLEDLDALAGSIAYAHADGWEGDNPLTIVTASVDRIVLERPLKSDRDMVLDGHICRVGRSSMIIGIEVRQAAHGGDIGKDDVVLRANFCMVARDRFNQRAASVNRLVAETEEERARMEKATTMAERWATAGVGSPTTDPSKEEFEKLHKRYVARTRRPPQYAVNMASTELSNTTLMHPQKRNVHQKIFGGYLLRLAFELSWACSNVFTGDNPHFFALDEVQFLQAVEIGDLMTFSAKVVHTTPSLIQIQVVASKLDATTGSRQRTNVFYFTYKADHPPRIIPETYGEMLTSLVGERRSLALEKEHAIGTDL